MKVGNLIGAFLLVLAVSVGASAADWTTIGTSSGDKMLEAYFRQETARLTERSLADVKTLEDWNAKKDAYRQQLFEMLGLDPLPERTPLKPVITGTVEKDAFRIEKLHFQSRPGLYVTGTVYVPKERKGKLPAILYVCGHGRVKKDGISYGNKATYQHHGAWFARNGYVCLIIDTLQLGEIEAIHHGTYREKMWWWNSRGYSSAAVEAWNGIRSLDYLQSREEVDGERLGITGRSGGGAYSWWVATLDERIKAAVPVAGIASLKNHVVDGCVEGHCDCMFMVNTYGWDFPQVAALVAPRALLISNTDKDRIFPLDGVVDVYNKTRRIYELHGKLDHIGLQITEGPHKDTQNLRMHAFHWFNKFLKGEDPLIETAAVKMFEPEELRVFETLPTDEKNTTIQETFVATAPAPSVPEDTQQWEQQRDPLLRQLKLKTFGGWPGESANTAESLELKQAFGAESQGVALAGYDITTQGPIRLQMYVAHRTGLKPAELDLTVLNVLDEQGWDEFAGTMRVGFAKQFPGEAATDADAKGFRELQGMLKNFKWGMAWIAPRGVGPTAWNPDERKQTQIRRRFMLLGQTRDGMRIWDVRRAVKALGSVEGFAQVPLWLQGKREAAGLALYAALFEPSVVRVDLWDLPRSHHEGPMLLNVLRFLDVPTTAALVGERADVRIYQSEAGGWEYPQAVARKLGWGEKRVQVRVVEE